VAERVYSGSSPAGSADRGSVCSASDWRFDDADIEYAGRGNPNRRPFMDGEEDGRDCVVRLDEREKFCNGF